MRVIIDIDMSDEMREELLKEIEERDELEDWLKVIEKEEQAKRER